MARLYTLLISALLLAPAASTVFTGFNYGAFWGVDSNVKKVADFRDSFSLAQDLNTGVLFNSARLFTCKTQGTVNEPTGAFDAAVDTKTNLLLGFWMTPQKRGDPLDEIIKNEMSALEKGFQKHGQALADLVVGLSVGSEDVYRWEETEGKDVGVSAVEISASIKKVKEAIASSTFAAYMKDKLIGHVDTAKYAVVDGADFFGMTAYPYWNKDPVAKGKESFFGSLNELKLRAGNTPIWIAEMGWPYEGAQQGEAVASAGSLQQYWTEVGCSVIGMYTTFWFELIKDSEANQPDWGLLDPATHKPRIDLKCPGLAEPRASAVPVSSLSGSSSTSPVSQTSQSTLATVSSLSEAPESSSPSKEPSMGNTVPATLATINSGSTIHVITTMVVTIQPILVKTSSVFSKASSCNARRKSSSIPPPKVTPGILPSNIPWCVTVADVAWDGQYVAVAGNPAGPDGKCSPPPTYDGLPYGGNQPTISPSSLSVSNNETSSVPSISSSKAVASSAAQSSSTLQAPAPTSSIIAPSSSIAPILGTPSMSSALVSSLVNQPTGKLISLVAINKHILIEQGTSQRSYCKPKSSTLANTEPKDASSASVPTAELPDSSKTSRFSSVALPSFTLVSDITAPKDVRYNEK
jgi:glucan endo-1,3-beta-D-glucosidase